MSLAVAPAAAQTAPVQPLRTVYAADAVAVAVAPSPAAAAPAPAERGREMPAVSPVAEIVLQANATTHAQATGYDCRVTGATETVRGFDRIAMVKEGFEHMRTLFEIANAKPETSAFGQVDMRA